MNKLEKKIFRPIVQPVALFSLILFFAAPGSNAQTILREASTRIRAKYNFYEMTLQVRNYKSKIPNMVKFTYSEKATKFCEISTLLLSVCTVEKRKVEISQNIVAFSATNTVMPEEGTTEILPDLKVSLFQNVLSVSSNLPKNQKKKFPGFFP